MDKTNVIVGGSNVSGNIGSCEVKSDAYTVSFWSKQTTAVNSCTGQIIAQNTYFNLGILIAGLFVIIFILGMIGVIKSK